MSGVNRRDFLTGGAAFLSLAAEAELLAGPVSAGMGSAALSGGARRTEKRRITVTRTQH